MSKLQTVRGTKDLLPDDFIKHQEIINKAIQISETYGFKPISTPIFEFTEVFARNLGESSDIVNKEMYSFTDRSGDSLTLRPEFTAGIVRSFVNNGLAHKLPFKCYSYGPVFRHERPQKGRQRQFHQFNVEFFGANLPIHDAEIIKMAKDILDKLGIEELSLEINSLGDKISRDNYRNKLVEYLQDFKNQLSEDSKIRLEKNPLRILDSKDENDKLIIKNVPKIYEHFTNEAKEYYSEVKYWLDILGVAYKENSNLVRGMDYYTHTAFEFITDQLGAQGTVLAGGRYDGMVEQMGGDPTKAIGFGAGIERLAEIYKQEHFIPRSNAIIPIGEGEVYKACILLADQLRKENIAIEVVTSKNLSKAMKLADKLNAYRAIFIGEEELNNKIARVKNLDKGDETQISLAKLSEFLAK